MIAYCLGLLGSFVHGVGGSLCVWGRLRLYYERLLQGFLLWLGLDILLYRFLAAIFIPLSCLYINGDDILAGGLGRFELLDTINCCYLADWIFCVKPRVTGTNVCYIYFPDRLAGRAFGLDCYLTMENGSWIGIRWNEGHSIMIPKI
jgi:hypothetical protein